MEFYSELLLHVYKTVMSDKYISLHKRTTESNTERNRESLNHGRTKLKFITQPWLSIHNRAAENYTQMEKCLNQLGMAKQFGWLKALKMSDTVRKARIRRKLRRGKKQAQGAGERERGRDGDALIACLPAQDGRRVDSCWRALQCHNRRAINGQCHTLWASLQPHCLHRRYPSNNPMHPRQTEEHTRWFSITKTTTTTISQKASKPNKITS